MIAPNSNPRNRIKNLPLYVSTTVFVFSSAWSRNFCNIVKPAQAFIIKIIANNNLRLEKNRHFHATIWWLWPVRAANIMSFDTLDMLQSFIHEYENAASVSNFRFWFPLNLLNLSWNRSNLWRMPLHCTSVSKSTLLWSASLTICICTCHTDSTTQIVLC